MYKSIFLFLILFSFTSTSIVKWLPNTSFNLPINFRDGKVPCPKQTVVFPENVLGSIRIESGTTVSEMILPTNGEFILAEGTITFGANSNELNCTDDSKAYFVDKSVSSWAQPDVWSSIKFNKATPDAERIPCYDDTVEFPKDAQFTVALPEVHQYVQDLIINGYSFSTEQFTHLVFTQSDQSQQFIVNQFQDTGVIVKRKQCRSRAGCPCQEHPPKIECSAKYCPVPMCIYPIKPIGHCCKICGGVISFDVDESFDIMEFTELVAKNVEGYGSGNLVYHIGRLNDNKVQLVVVDKDEYVGTSAEVVNAIDNLLQRDWVIGAKEAQISGSPLYKSGLGGKIVISMFFAVIFVMGAIYVYYYKVPEVSYPLVRQGGSRGMFSRFQRRTDSVVSLTRRDSGAHSSSDIRTAFRNPLYDSKRGRVQVVEPVLEE